MSSFGGELSGIGLVDFGGGLGVGGGLGMWIASPEPARTSCLVGPSPLKSFP